MFLTSFSSFASACIALVFSRSGINVDQVQLKQFLSEFLEFVQEHTLTEIAYEQFATESLYALRMTQQYGKMYNNFMIFLDFALKNICVIDEQTLYNGLSTQINKFKTMYDSLENFKFGGYGYYCSCCCNSLTFDDVIYQIQMVHSHLYYMDLEIWIQNEIADILDPNLKQLNANLCTRKTRGQRKDYEQYKFNKGLITRKRQRITQKSHKNKKNRDFSV
jgi:hypothetical protein